MKLAIFLLIILTIGSAIFLQSKYKTIPKIQPFPIASSSASVQASPTPSPQLTPTYKPNVSPLQTFKPTLYPTPTPIPTSPKPIISSMKISLGRSSNAMSENAKGDVDIKVVDSTPYGGPDTLILSFRYDLSLRNMESGREYIFFVCEIDEGDCVGIGQIKTDGSGNVNYSGGGGVTFKRKSPIKYLKVNQTNGGICSNALSPCLRADYPLDIP